MNIRVLLDKEKGLKHLAVEWTMEWTMGCTAGGTMVF